MDAEQPDERERLESWLTQVERHWRRRGVPRAAREHLVASLTRDLAVTMSQGASIDDLVADDPVTFADALIEAEGVPTGRLHSNHRLTTLSFLVVAFGGALLGGLLSLAIVYPPGMWLIDLAPVGRTGQGILALSVHALASCLAVATSMFVVSCWFGFEDHTALRRTVLIGGVSLLVAGALSVAPTMAFARRNDYTWQTEIVLTEVLIVSVFLLAGLGSARWAVKRTGRPSQTT